MHVASRFSAKFLFSATNIRVCRHPIRIEAITGPRLENSNSLSELQELSAPDSGIDLGALVTEIVTGALSGSSAGLSGGSSKSSSKGSSEDAESSVGYKAPPQVEIIKPPPAPKRQKLGNGVKQSPKGSSSQKKTRLRYPNTQYRPQATHPEILHLPQDNQYVQLVPQYQYEQIAAPANYGGYGTYGVSLTPRLGSFYPRKPAKPLIPRLKGSSP
jgi:hypothetical protein